MTDNEKVKFAELLTVVAQHLGAVAVGMAIIMPTGETGFLTLVAHEPDARADPALFGRLSDELYKCALQAATAATHGEKYVS